MLNGCFNGAAVRIRRRVWAEAYAAYRAGASMGPPFEYGGEMTTWPLVS